MKKVYWFLQSYLVLDLQALCWIKSKLVPSISANSANPTRNWQMLRKKAKCGVCHPEKDKKKKNDYGTAVGKGLEKKNEKDLDKIKAALKKAETQKNADGKAFGDIIKEGKLPI